MYRYGYGNGQTNSRTVALPLGRNWGRPNMPALKGVVSWNLPIWAYGRNRSQIVYSVHFAPVLAALSHPCITSTDIHLNDRHVIIYLKCLTGRGLPQQNLGENSFTLWWAPSHHIDYCILVQIINVILLGSPNRGTIIFVPQTEDLSTEEPAKKKKVRTFVTTQNTLSFKENSICYYVSRRGNNLKCISNC